MKRPSVTIARDICRRLHARGVIVLAVYDGRKIAGASYGETKAKCTALGQVLDAIVSGDQPIPWGEVEYAIETGRGAPMSDLPHADIWSPGRTFLVAPVVAYIERGWHVVCRGCVETIGDSVRVHLERRESPERYSLDPREPCEVCHVLLTVVRDRLFAELDRAR